jgi:predicted hydrolase (HD superfamily)
MLTLDDAEALLREWTTGESLLAHARAVELVMAKAAYAYGRGAADETAFRLAGILHDADYERWPGDHPRRIVERLEGLGEHAVARAIAAHYSKWGVPAESPLDKALLAADELTGFVVAAARVHPDGLAGLTPASVLKKLKNKSFAAKVEREEVRLGADLLGVELADHIQLVLDALRPHAAEVVLVRPTGKGPERAE